jgi:Cu-Zn family superoxide dismutase
MKKAFFVKLVTAILFITATAFACNSNKGTTSNGDSTGKDHMNESETHAMATAEITGTKPDTAVNGTASFEKDGNNVKMHLELTIPAKANKSVAVHIHAMGDCGDMGKMAGGHWNPTNENHGKWGSGSYHSGDIGNVSLDGSGKGTLDLSTDRWSIGGDTTKNIIGKTIIVHGGVDDYTSQPAGNSGERIGCGVIKQ